MAERIDFFNDLGDGFPARLRKLREDKIGVSQRELAEDLQISPRLVYFYESGLNTPGGKILRRMAVYFDVPVEYLLGLPDERKETLCWSCAKFAGGCSWSRTFTPVKGWLAVKRVSHRKGRSREPAGFYESYTILE